MPYKGTKTKVVCISLGIRDFGVHPDRQGSGNGKALMNYAIEEARGREVNIGLAGASGKLSSSS
jgi:GNAT superfamily N-acetyltransferase